ncbi:hypothetical protein IG631_00748 [Alternaria alternata]|nr:hypothetical protein IG631_00748 [Alternaria alternata]
MKAARLFGSRNATVLLGIVQTANDFFKPLNKLCLGADLSSTPLARHRLNVELYVTWAHAQFVRRSRCSTIQKQPVLHPFIDPSNDLHDDFRSTHAVFLGSIDDSARHPARRSNLSNTKHNACPIII